MREAKELVIEEVFVGKLLTIFRSPKKLVELTEDLKEKQDYITNIIDMQSAHLCVCMCLCLFMSEFHAIVEQREQVQPILYIVIIIGYV